MIALSTRPATIIIVSESVSSIHHTHVVNSEQFVPEEGLSPWGPSTEPLMSASPVRADRDCLFAAFLLAFSLLFLPAILRVA